MQPGSTFTPATADFAPFKVDIDAKVEFVKVKKNVVSTEYSTCVRAFVSYVLYNTNLDISHSSWKRTARYSKLTKSATGFVNTRVMHSSSLTICMVQVVATLRYDSKETRGVSLPFFSPLLGDSWVRSKRILSLSREKIVGVLFFECIFFIVTICLACNLINLQI